MRSGSKHLCVAYALVLGLPGIAAADYYDGLRAFDARDYAAAQREWEAAAKAGDGRSGYRLGQLYEQGLGVRKSAADAHRWYSQAVAAGVAEAAVARDRVAAGLKLGPGARAAAASADALRAAAKTGDEARVRAMLDGGAEVDAADSDGWTALTYAAFAGHDGVVKALLARGAKVDHANTDGVTPLMAAALAGRGPVVDLLRASGAQSGLQDKAGRTAADLASARGYVTIAARLGATSASAVAPVAIREAQKLLAALGLDPGAADGVMGRRTEAAVREFQRRAGLAVDGQVTPRLLETLRGAAAQRPVAAQAKLSERPEAFPEVPRVVYESEAFRGAPPSRAVAVDREWIDADGKRQSSSTRMVDQDAIVRRELTRSFGSETVGVGSLGGLVNLYSISKGEESTLRGATVELSRIQGRLFPLRVGNRAAFQLKKHWDFASNLSKESDECPPGIFREEFRVVERVAGTSHGLPGDVYRIHNRTESTMYIRVAPLSSDFRTPSVAEGACEPSTSRRESEVFFSEDLGEVLHSFDGGEMDRLRVQFALADGSTVTWSPPAPGRGSGGKVTAARLGPALRADDVATVQRYLREGGDPDKRLGPNPLLVAALEAKAWKAARVLLKGGARADSDGSGDTPLEVAIKQRQAELVRELIVAGANPNRPGSWSAPLGLAIDEGDAAVIEALLAGGADPNRADRYGKPPLFQALSSYNERLDKTAAVLALLKYGADPNRRDSDGKTALHSLALDREADAAALARALVRAGAQVNATDARGWTPLHSFTVGGCMGDPKAAGGVSVLLEAGAVVDVGVDAFLRDALRSRLGQAATCQEVLKTFRARGYPG